MIKAPIRHDSAWVAFCIGGGYNPTFWCADFCMEHSEYCGVGYADCDFNFGGVCFPPSYIARWDWSEVAFWRCVQKQGWVPWERGTVQ